MLTVPQTPVPAKAYHAQFHGLSGILTRPTTAIVFLRDTGELHQLSEADMPHVIVLGEVAEAMSAYIADMVAGGYAAVATSRQNLEAR